MSAPGARPLIGVTTYRNLSSQGYPQFSTSQAYCDSLAQAGASPVMIPSGLPDETLSTLISRLNGILFSGGGDIHPECYGSKLHPLVANVDTDRDHLEISLLHQAIQVGAPFFGICRGLQAINVALGGSLYEDILDQRQESIPHQYYPDWPREHLAHSVQIEPGSRLADILGGVTFSVNSLHHQGIRILASGMQASAYAPDGLIEAIELPDYPFGLAVQWHPENLQAHPPMRALFRTFVQAAEQRMHS